MAHSRFNRSLRVLWREDDVWTIWDTGGVSHPSGNDPFAHPTIVWLMLSMHPDPSMFSFSQRCLLSGLTSWVGAFQVGSIAAKNRDIPQELISRCRGPGVWRPNIKVAESAGGHYHSDRKTEFHCRYIQRIVSYHKVVGFYPACSKGHLLGFLAGSFAHPKSRDVRSGGSINALLVE